MDGIKYVRIILENCEAIKIDGKNVGYFMLDDIRHSIQVFGCNAFGHAKTAELFAIEINKSENRKNKPFGFEDENNLTIFDRLTRFSDITSVEVVENNGQVNECFVKWDGDDYINNNQTSFIGDNGNLYIAVSKNTKAKDLFKEYQSYNKWSWMRNDWGENNAE